MTTDTRTRIYNTWAERLTRHPVHHMTKSEIQAFARRVTPLAEHGVTAHNQHTTLTEAEAKLLRATVGVSPVRLTEGHTEQGYKWLERHGGKQLGRATMVRYMVEHFDHFTWDGDVEYLHLGGWVGTKPFLSTVPIWTVHTRKAELDGTETRRTFKYWFASGWRERRGSVGEVWEVNP